MANDRPTKPFNLHAEPEALRDKDNTSPKLAPKLPDKKPAPNLAPGGTMGIQRGLPVPEKDQAKRFSFQRNGDLTRQFNPVAKPRDTRDPSRER